MNNKNSDPPRKASPVAIIGLTSSVLALFLSLNTCVYNIGGYIAKADMTFIPPEQMTLYASGPKERPYLAMVTDFNIFNNSRPDKYGVVTGERIEFSIGGVQHVLRWQEFGRWADTKFESKEQVHPFSLIGGKIETQEVSFEPRSKDRSELLPGETPDVNWVDWPVFLQFLDQNSTLNVHCVLESLNGKTITADVVLSLHDGIKNDLRNPDVKWAAVRCKKL